VASTKKGLIIVPEPGQLFAELGGLVARDAAGFGHEPYLVNPAAPPRPPKEEYMLEFFAYEQVGCTPAHVVGVDPAEEGAEYGVSRVMDAYDGAAKYEALKKEMFGTWDGQAEAAPLTKAAVKDALEVMANPPVEHIKNAQELTEKFGVPKAEVNKLNAAVFEALNAKNTKSAIDAVNDFTRQKMREDGFFRKIMPALDVTNDELDTFTGDGPWKVVDGVDVVFWYYRDTSLIYSVRRVSDNFFYDFASKKFSLMPVAPRAGMPRAEPAKPSGCFYSTRLSGKLDDGEYIVTFRDAQALDVVVGIMAVFMKGGIQSETPPQGLEDTPIEEGIPTPEGYFRRAERRVRPVDVGEPG
jgi:hypothetical protein